MEKNRKIELKLKDDAMVYTKKDLDKARGEGYEKGFRIKKDEFGKGVKKWTNRKECYLTSKEE